MDICIRGISGQINFKWDMCSREFMHLMAPLPEEMHDVTEYDGAVFFGNVKLEFVKNDVAGPFCNMFLYGTEGYNWLEDGTPYDERLTECEQIRIRYFPTFSAFADDVEKQVLRVLCAFPDLIPDALGPTDPNKWYPCDHPYHIEEITREA